MVTNYASRKQSSQYSYRPRIYVWNSIFVFTAPSRIFANYTGNKDTTNVLDKLASKSVTEAHFTKQTTVFSLASTVSDLRLMHVRLREVHVTTIARAAPAQ